MALQIYNTMTQKKENFEPLEKGKVKLYVCGPTVYQLLHVGNFRGPVVYNMLRNWLEHLGYKVTYVYNFTDVDDKIITAANEQGVTSTVISERFIQEFKKDYEALGLSPHSFNPKVTEHMDDIVKMIEEIIKKGHGYVKEGEVFFSIDSFKNYGKLSHKNIDELIAGSRVEVDPRKKNPMDFSLWKPAKPGEPKWPSPWGEGRPGWHIECS
ncbi:MAG: class I tRNA ligase family protein, partial [Bdellovibrionales bacterium]|nr:class I tRNA ligase family protein [Bdellovibrionales bacterium]